MHRFTSTIRRPVKREGAEHYVLLMLLSFAASVTLTRLFLAATGYPQIATSYFHIAHVLWGGLLLFAASLLPLVAANRWAYTLGALLSGVGVGLFIDEVGKFITQTNDYFTPWAAPIIYALFLLNVLVYLRVRRPPSRSPRAELYRAFDAMEEVLEHDLDPQEREELDRRLAYVAENEQHPDLASLARSLRTFLECETITLAPHRPPFVVRLEQRWERFEARWITRLRLKATLIGGFLALGLVGLANMVQAVPVGPMARTLEQSLMGLLAGELITTTGGTTWFVARLALESTVGVLFLVAAGLLLARRDNLGLTLGHMSLLLALTVVNLLVFYFDQFFTIFPATVQFLLLLAAGYYRREFLDPKN
jgi:hypothetical protein